MGEPRKILWSERDVGQRLSMIVGGGFFLAVTALMVFVGIRSALAGDWWQLLLPIGFIGMSVELLAQWKRRNAR